LDFTAHGSGGASVDDASDTTAQEPTLNPKLTFDQFVIGDSNRLAHAAGLAVAEMPGQAYNPLFICGPPGVGKTHLLYSIGHLIQTHNPGLSIHTSTGEAFTNQFQLAVGSRQMDAFKARFRRLDVLLIDDVQFFERKTKTEEEFFHTFNALYEVGSQIVLTSDRPPRDLGALEDRLRERFQAGLVADISPPDLPTRIAILRKRAHCDQILSLDQAVLELIADRVQTNVRALEGALIRVVAYGSLTGRRLTSELATEVLDRLYPQSSRKLHTDGHSIATIQATVCSHFGISESELLSTSRASRIARPRQLAMYLARELTTQSLPAIGRHFGGRDHTTVLHACRQAQIKLANDPDFQTTVENVRHNLSVVVGDRNS
jgi:chromosomal replication initiator protein